MMFAEVIGDPIAQSKSPVIHKFWLDALGIKGDYRRAHVSAHALADYLANARLDPAWRGCNVTMPHKIAVMALVDKLDPIASRVGAVNTVVQSDDHLVGFNTDVAGIVGPLSHPDRAIGQYDNHVATYAQIIGTGGAARAAIAALAQVADLEFYSRSRDKAAALAKECGLSEWFGMGLDQLGPIRNEGDTGGDQRYSHIVVNASPMGMVDQPSVPIDLERYYPDTIVFDMVYAPLHTPLLAAARASGLRTIDGFEMLIGQAARAFELFFGATPPRERDQELRTLLLK